MVSLADNGLFLPSAEKDIAGLQLFDGTGAPLFDARFPGHVYDSFDAIPPLATVRPVRPASEPVIVLLPVTVMPLADTVMPDVNVCAALNECETVMVAATSVSTAYELT